VPLLDGPRIHAPVGGLTRSIMLDLDVAQGEFSSASSAPTGRKTTLFNLVDRGLDDPTPAPHGLDAADVTRLAATGGHG